MLITKDNEEIKQIFRSREDYINDFLKSDPEITKERLSQSYDMKVESVCRMSNNIREGAWEHPDQDQVLINYNHVCDDPLCLELYMFRKCAGCKEEVFNEEIAKELESNDFYDAFIATLLIWKYDHYSSAIVIICSDCYDEVNEQLDKI